MPNKYRNIKNGLVITMSEADFNKLEPLRKSKFSLIKKETESKPSTKEVKK